MTNDEVCKVFDGQMEKLNGYFHNEIRLARIRDDFEELKRDLIHDTFEAVWKKIRSGNYDAFKLEALIWLKAPDIWKRFAKKQGRLAISRKPVEEYPELTDSVNLPANLELKNQLAKMRQVGNTEVWKMLDFHAEGYKYKEIADFFDLEAGTVKVSVSRLRTDVIRISW